MPVLSGAHPCHCRPAGWVQTDISCSLNADARPPSLDEGSTMWTFHTCTASGNADERSPSAAEGDTGAHAHMGVGQEAVREEPCGKHPQKLVADGVSKGADAIEFVDGANFMHHADGHTLPREQSAGHVGAPQLSRKVRSLTELYEADGEADEERKRTKRCGVTTTKRQRGADHKQNEVIDLRNT